MKLLILLTIACLVAVSAVPVPCGPAPVHVPAPVYNAGSGFVHKDYEHGSSAVHGSNFNAAHGGSFIDQKEHNQKTKHVIENESSSKHTKGGSSFGAASGSSFGALNTHDRGSVTAGTQHLQVVG